MLRLKILTQTVRHPLVDPLTATEQNLTQCTCPSHIGVCMCTDVGLGFLSSLCSGLEDRDGQRLSTIYFNANKEAKMLYSSSLKGTNFQRKFFFCFHPERDPLSQACLKLKNDDRQQCSIALCRPVHE